MDISGKVGLVTGGADGIGKVMVHNLLQKGAKGVAVIDFNNVTGKETLKELQESFGKERVIFCKADVSVREELRDAFKKTLDTFGALHIVCNNAGIVDEVNWEKMLRVNLNGTINGTVLALEHMESGGVVVQTSSIAAFVSPEYCRMYSVSKEAINAFTTNIALYDPIAKEKRIRLNCICPAKVDKPVSESSHFATKHAFEKVASLIDDPAKKAAKAVYICTMQDVANAMLMMVEGDFNGKSSVVLSNAYPIIKDYNQEIRQEAHKIFAGQEKKMKEELKESTGTGPVDM